jgi:hypothetical protein
VYSQALRPVPPEGAAEEARGCFPIALRRLPGHLDVLHMTCTRDQFASTRVVYVRVRVLCMDLAYQIIGVTSLEICFRFVVQREYFSSQYRASRADSSPALTNGFTHSNTPHTTRIPECLLFTRDPSQVLARSCQSVILPLLPACVKLQALALSLCAYETRWISISLSRESGIFYL